jgi:hypothetical protein
MEIDLPPPVSCPHPGSGKMFGKYQNFAHFWHLEMKKNILKVILE